MSIITNIFTPSRLKNILFIAFLLFGIISPELAMAQNTITITTPDSDDVFNQGDQVTFYWSDNYNLAHVGIDLINSSGNVEMNITEYFPNANYYTWSMPGSVSPGSYKIEVYQVTEFCFGGNCQYVRGTTDDISESFDIQIPELDFDQSYDGSEIIAGEDFYFEWNHNLTSGQLELHYGHDMFGWTEIATLSNTATSYTWTTPSGSFPLNPQIRIRSTGSSGLEDQIDVTLLKDVEVTGPISSTNQSGGSTLNISWGTNYNGGDVRIDLYKGGNHQQTLTTSTTNDGSYSWNIPIDIATGSNYQIRVKDTGSSTEDFSSNFTLTKASITVTTPSSSTSKIGGSTLAIGWDANYGNTTVQVDLYKNGTLQQTLNSSITIGNDSYDWEIPTDITTGSDYQIRVKDSGSSIDGYSPNFSLTKASFTVTGPTGSDEFLGGDDVTITWTDNFSPDTVGIDLLNGDGSFNQNIAEEITNTGSYVFTLSTALAEGNYYVEVYDMPDSAPLCLTGDDPPCYYRGNIDDQSEAFEIISHQVQITQPTGSSNGLMPGDNLFIEWATTSSPVTLELVRESNFQTWNIAQDQSSTTSYPSSPVYNTMNWATPGDLPFGSYFVRITSNDATTESEVFEIGPTLSSAQKVITFNEYDAWGNVIRAIDANGTVLRFYYGSNTQPFTQDGKNGTEGVYLTGMSRVFAGGTDSLTTTGTYNNMGHLTEMTSQSGVDASFSYDNFGRLDTVYNDNGDPISAMEYVYTGSQFSATNPNYIETIAYTGDDGGPRYATQYLDGLGRSIQTQQQDGTHDIVSTIEYDGAGREFRSWKPYRWDTGHQYDSDWAGNDTTYYANEFPYIEQYYEQSPMNRVVKVVPEGGQATSGADSTAYRLDNWNGDTYSVTESIDAEGNVTETWSDGWGRTVRTVADPDGIVAATVFEYDVEDNLRKVTAPNGTETTYSYDSRGNLIQKTSDDAGTVQYKYDLAGNLRFSQDANRAAAGEVVFTSYDELGRPVVEGVVSASFGSLDGDTDYGFATTNANVHGAYAYDSKPPTSNNYPFDQFVTELGSVDLTNTNGQLTARAWRINDGSSSVIGSNPWQLEALSYDSEGRLADKWIFTANTSAWTTHLNYTYNRAGEVIKQKTDINGEVLYHHYSYNQRELLDSVFVSTDGVNPTTAEVVYSYTATGAIDNIDYNGSKDVDYGYTIRDWVKSINDIASPAGNFAAFYDYTDNGNVETAEYHNPQVQSGGGANTHSWDFSYDGLNRLDDADFAADGAGPFDLSGLGYDKAGNITDLQRRDETGSLIDNLTYSYNGSNRLQSVSDAAGQQFDWDAAGATFGYDAAGNLTSQTGKLDGVAYEHRNLPVQFALTSGDTVVTNYNADGQRILKELKGGAWQFYVMDGQQTLAVIDNTGLSHFNLTGNATFGRWEPGGTRRYFITDHLGSTRAVVDNNGNVLETFDYYPFGLLMPKRNTAGANTIEKFTGKERDTEAGLNLDYFGARYYDPALGRWHNSDPILNELRPDSLLKIRNGVMYSNTPYNYTLNNPVRYLDPNGKCPEPAEKDGTICFALFIQAEKAIGLKGDNRDFSSSSDPSQSRIFIHIDVENQTTEITQNPSCTTSGDCTEPLSTNEIAVSFGDFEEEGQITVSVDAKNSAIPGPAINGTFTFTPDGNGGFTTSGDRDAFPSTEAYLWEGGKAKPLFNRNEKTPFHLFPFYPNDIWPNDEK